MAMARKSTSLQVWHGVIAGSAPIWAFEGEHPPIDPNYFAKGVTYDTSTAAGAAPGCTDALRNAWKALISLAEADDGAGVAEASKALNICPHRRLNTTDDAYAARGWASSAFDMMAMGNYPFESGYMLNGNGVLPAFPVRVACQALMDTYTAERSMARLTPAAQVRISGVLRLLTPLPVQQCGSERTPGPLNPRWMTALQLLHHATGPTRRMRGGGLRCLTLQYAARCPRATVCPRLPPRVGTLCWP